MEDEVCVCMADKARKSKRFRVGGAMVGIVQLDQVMDEVRFMRLSEKGEISKALIKRIRLFNYVPSSASAEYEEALMEEYSGRFDR